MNQAATLDPVSLAYHELRSPLGLMVSAAASVAEGSTDEAAREQCAIIVRAGERMLRTVGHLFAIAERADAEAEPAPYRPVEIVSRIAGELAGLGSAVSVSTSPAAVATEVMGVSSDLEALVSSLAMNAHDHGKPDEPIAFTVDANDDSLRIRIANVAACERRHRGLGLGTALCRLLADRMGAELTAERDGDTFAATIALPLV